MKEENITCGINEVRDYRGKNLNYIIGKTQKKRKLITYFGEQHGPTSNRIADHCRTREYGENIKIILLEPDDINLGITPKVSECLLDIAMEEKFKGVPEEVERTSKSCLKGLDPKVKALKKAVLKRFLNDYDGVL